MSVSGQNRMLFSETRIKRKERRDFWLAWLIVGLIIYFAYSRKNSKLNSSQL